MINRFVVNDDNIILLQDLPNDLQSLVINNVNIVPLFVFPLQLKIFSCDSCKKISIPLFTKNLMTINILNSNIVNLPDTLPQNLNILNCSNNNITHLPKQ